MWGGNEDNSQKCIQIHVNYFKFTEQEKNVIDFYIYYKIILKCQNMVKKTNEPNYGNC